MFHFKINENIAYNIFIYETNYNIITNCSNKELHWVCDKDPEKRLKLFYAIHYITSLLGVEIPKASSYPIFVSCLSVKK